MKPPAPVLCKIPTAVWRKLRVLYLIGRFAQGCFGKVRLQKVAYFSEKEQGTRLFTFRKAPYGPFSQDLDSVLEELLSMGLVVAEPLETGDGNSYRLADQHVDQSPYGDWLAAIDPRARPAIDRAAERYGYLKLEDLIQAGHDEQAFRRVEAFEEVLRADAPDVVEARLTPDDCEDLILSLAPGLAHTLRRLPDAVASFDFSRVRPL